MGFEKVKNADKLNGDGRFRLQSGKPRLSRVRINLLVFVVVAGGGIENNLIRQYSKKGFNQTDFKGDNFPVSHSLEQRMMRASSSRGKRKMKRKGEVQGTHAS